MSTLLSWIFGKHLSKRIDKRTDWRAVNAVGAVLSPYDAWISKCGQGHLVVLFFARQLLPHVNFPKMSEAVKKCNLSKRCTFVSGLEVVNLYITCRTGEPFEKRVVVHFLH